MLIGPMAIRVGTLLRQITVEYEIEMLSGKVGRDHVHISLAFECDQDFSMAEGNQFKGTTSELCLPSEAVLEWARLGQRMSACQLRDHLRRS